MRAPGSDLRQRGTIALDMATTDRIQGLVQTYLGMRDARLPMPVADLVPAGDVSGYPTNFRAMPTDALDSISLRGEQLTRVLLAYYCPEVLALDR